MIQCLNYKPVKLKFEYEISAKTIFTEELISHTLKQFACLNTDKTFEKLIGAVRRLKDMENVSSSEIAGRAVLPTFVHRKMLWKNLIVS